MGDARVVTVKAQPLTADAWAPFGWLPVHDTDPADGEHMLEFVWGDPHVNVISHAYDEVEHADRRARCDRLYRHDTHTQTLMVLNCDAVMAVAPASIDFSQPEHLDEVRAFLLHPLACFVLHRGTWHWGPFPTRPGTAELFNIQGRRYVEDNASIELEVAVGAALEVVP
jgi:ureidoglycolate hydrolase